MMMFHSTHLDRRFCRKDFCLVGSCALSNSTDGFWIGVDTRRWPCWLPLRLPPVRRDSHVPAAVAFVAAWRELPGPYIHAQVSPVRCCSARQLSRCPCNKKKEFFCQFHSMGEKEKRLMGKKSNKDFLLSLSIKPPVGKDRKTVHFD